MIREICPNIWKNIVFRDRSPPGYVGYEEGGQPSGMRRTIQSHSLTIEKAHPMCLIFFQQVLDDGQVHRCSRQQVDLSR